MNFHRAFLLTGLLLAWPFCPTGRAWEVRYEEKGTYLGALFSPRTVPASTTSKTTILSGVLITHVIPNSPAARADLRTNDVLLRYDRKPIRDGDHLATLIQADKPDRKLPLLILRAGRELTIEVTLALGPALKLSPPSGRGAAPAVPDPTPPGTVCVTAAPLGANKMRLTIEYYAAGKREVVTCEGMGTELASTVRKLPERERTLVRIALQRLRTLNTQSPPAQR